VHDPTGTAATPGAAAREQIDEEPAAARKHAQRERRAIARLARLKVLLAFALAFLAFGAYYNSLSGELVQDDTPQIAENPMIGNWSLKTIKGAFARDFWANIEPEHARDRIDSVYYRPIFLLALMAGDKLAGSVPKEARNDASYVRAWHLIAIALHVLVALLVFIAIDLMLAASTRATGEARTVMSAAATAIFVVHPVQSESVAWISGLVGPLSTLFMVGAFICYLKFRGSKSRLAFAGAIALFTLALFTKEQALVLPVVLLACEYLAFSRMESKKVTAHIWTLLIAMSGAVGVYLASRYAAIGTFLGRSSNLNFPDDSSLTLGDQLLTAPGLFMQYAKLVVYPADLSFMYPFGYVRNASVAGFWIPLAMTCAVAALLVYGIYRAPAVAVASVWMLIPLLPHFNTRAFVSDEIIHDRYLYGSMIGAGMIAVWLIWQASRLTVVRASLMGSLITILLILTIAQNRQWGSKEILWDRAKETAPDSRLVQLALGALAENRRDSAAALAEYEAVLSKHPDVLDALNNAALLGGRAGRWDQAVGRFERIVELTPDKAIAHFNLSFAYSVLGRHEEAATSLRRALVLDPSGERADEWRERLAQLEKIRSEEAARRASGAALHQE
jgi:tetratricopeptide (TPR) repeat protein